MGRGRDPPLYWTVTGTGLFLRQWTVTTFAAKTQAGKMKDMSDAAVWNREANQRQHMGLQ